MTDNRVQESPRPTLSLDDLRRAVQALSRDPGPILPGRIEIDEAGRPARRDTATPLRLTFAHRGVDYRAEILVEPQPRVRMSADLGRLPYSIEVGGRRSLARLVVEASAILPRSRIVLSEGEGIALVAEAAPPLPLTPVGIMATLVALVLEVRPHLDLLARTLDPGAFEPAVHGR